MLENVIEYNLIKDAYKIQKIKILLNAKEYYKGHKEILIPLLRPCVFGEDESKERDLGNKTFMQKTFKLSLLEKHDQIPISEKENEL